MVLWISLNRIVVMGCEMSSETTETERPKVAGKSGRRCTCCSVRFHDHTTTRGRPKSVRTSGRDQDRSSCRPSSLNSVIKRSLGNGELLNEVSFGAGTIYGVPLDSARWKLGDPGGYSVVPGVRRHLSSSQAWFGSPELSFFGEGC